MSDRRRRFIRFSLWSLGGLLGVILVLLGLVSLLLYTEAGSRRATEYALTQLNQQDGIEVRTGRVSGNLLRGLTLDEVVVRLPTAEISAHSLRASWNPYSLLSGNFYLSSLILDTLVVTVIDDPAAATSGATDPKTYLRLEPLPVDVAVGLLAVTNFTLRLDGQVTQIPELRFGAELNGQTLRLRDARVRIDTLSVDLDLEAELRDDIPIQASVNWEYQGPLFANYQLAVGTAAVTGNLDALTIQHGLLAPEAIQSSGQILAPLSTDDLSLNFTHTADSLRLPRDGLQEYLFQRVSLQTRWAGADLELALASEISSNELPSAQLTASGTLAGSELQIPDLRLATATGALDASGSVDWSGPVTIASRFTVSEADPLQYLQAELPVDLSDISGNGEIDYRNVDGQNRVELSIENFEGLLSGYPLTGRAELSLVDSALQIDSLRLQTIDNEIDVSGAVNETVQLAWQISAPALNQLLTGYGGALSGSGTLSGDPGNPQVAGALRLERLETGAVYVDTIDITLSGTTDAIETRLALAGLDIQGEESVTRIDSIDVQASGGLSAHTVEANLESATGNLQLRLQGGLPAGSTNLWEGNLLVAELQSDFGHWTKQDGPSSLTLSRTASALPRTCWLNQSTRLCLALAQSGADRLRVDATLDNFPLSDFNRETTSLVIVPHPALPSLPAGMRLSGTVSANASGEIDFARTPQFSFELTAQQAVLTISSSQEADVAIDETLLAIEEQEFNWDVLRLAGTLERGVWTLNGDAELSRQNLAGTNLGLRGLLDSELTIDADGNLGGVTEIRFEELGWLQAFLPELSEVGGSLTGDVTVSGTVSAPLFAGELDLRDGRAKLEQLGLNFTDISSSVQGRSSGDVQLSGQLSSNTGNLAFSGTIADLYNDTRRLEASISGSDFQLLNTDDASLAVSPDIRLTARHDLIALTGALDIPLLTLVLRELPESAIDVSRDTVIVSYPEDRPELARTISAAENTLFDIPVAADIDLTLGEAVNVSGFGMTANLDGELSIQQRADGSNLTYGELGIVEGNYRIYGQELSLRQGKLLFFGAMDNPALDIRATREVDGVTVGVLMNGTLKNIRSQLFSTPALPENDIIAVLVTGRPASELGEQDSSAVLGAVAALGLDRGQGLTSQIRDTLGLDTLGINNTGNINSSMLTIGKYLTPDIFIRYGVGLFDRQSKVAIDYSLTERVTLQAESGEYQSLDLTYRVER